MNRLSRRPADRYQPPEPARELTVTSADGSRLYAQTHGPTDAPAVVLVHGWTCSTAMWAPIIRELATDHHVIAYDLRGHGRSPAGPNGRLATHGPGRPSIDLLVRDLTAVLDQALPSGRRAVVVGHSMGAMAVLAAAGDAVFTERAAAVVLCSTGTSRLVAEVRVLPLPAGRLRTRVHRAVLGSPAPLGPVTAVGSRVLKYATMGRAASPEAVTACARIVHACPRRVRAAWAQVLETLDIDPQAARLTVPTSVVVGTEDRLTPRQHARDIAARLPHCARLTEVPGVGHMTPFEVPDLVVAHIRARVADQLGGAGQVTTGPTETAVPTDRRTGAEGEDVG